MVYCNNSSCEHNIDDQRCSMEDIYYIDKLCMTYRRRIDGRQLMRQPFNARCHREGGKYKSDSGRVIR